MADLPIPCPFCGTAAKIHKDLQPGSRNEYYCPRGHTGYMRLKEWNTRNITDSQRAEVAVSDAMVEAACEGYFEDGDSFKGFPTGIKISFRRDMRYALTAALAAIGE